MTTQPNTGAGHTQLPTLAADPAPVATTGCPSPEADSLAGSALSTPPRLATGGGLLVARLSATGPVEVSVECFACEAAHPLGSVVAGVEVVAKGALTRKDAGVGPLDRALCDCCGAEILPALRECRDCLELVPEDEACACEDEVAGYRPEMIRGERYS